ncbi:MAG: hypothetical protein FD180_3476 [Planctomycetota bacterium]|nr:MAG: hypothetical protein FD180_3476 [Planctomycetota bacterium]
MSCNAPVSMLPVASASGHLAGLGFERIQTIHGSTYRDCSTVIVSPTRGLIHHRVVAAWQSLIAPMNQKRAFLFVAGDEVGHAYNNFLQQVLAHPELSTWKYVLTLEDDNLPPPDAHIRLLEAIDAGPFDAVSGLYFTKGDVNMPQCYGDPEVHRRLGALEFQPRDVVGALARGQLVECNGIAMGCALWRMDLFRKIPPPWFVTVADWFPDKGGLAAMTQDLYFCKKAKEAGKSFAVDCRVKVGHLDPQTGIVY